MNLKGKMPMIVVAAVLTGGAAVMVSNIVNRSDNGAAADVRVPDLSAQATAGEAVFSKNCAACHGQNAAGSDKGPPLINDIYNPGHHPDEAFYQAAKMGVRQHHWRFGDMPPQPKVTEADVMSVLAYIREMQRANGIFYKPHNM